MASSIKLYTLSDLMDVVTITSVTPSAATSYAKELMLDNNPDTYYKAANTSSALDISFDLGSAKVVQAVAIWYRNHLSQSQPSSAYLLYSSNGTDWTQDSVIAPHFGDSTYASYPCRLYSVVTTSAYRYWRIAQSAASTVAMQVSGIWFLKKHDIGQGSEYPENDQIAYFNRTHKATGGRRVVSAINRNSQLTMTRKFVFPLDANFNELIAAFQESYGSRWPIFYRDGNSLPHAAIMCRMTHDSISKAMQSHKIYEPSIVLEQFVSNNPTYGY